MKRLFFVMVMLVLLVSTVSAVERHYEIKLIRLGGDIINQGVNVIGGKITETKQQSDGYKAEIVSFDNKALYSLNFGIVGAATIKLPYFEDGKDIKVYNKNGNEVLDLDVGYYAKTCGNNVCNDNEDFKSCPDDCSKDDSDIFSGIQEDRDIFDIIVYVGVFLIIIMTLGLVVVYINRKR